MAKKITIIIMIVMTTKITNPSDIDFLHGVRGFVERYERNCAYYRSCKEAYEVTEKQYTTLAGKPRYSSYESFRANYSKYCQRKRSK